MFIEKFNLYNDFSYLLGDNTENIIRQISNLSFKGAKLGFKLADANNLLPVFSPEYFIKKAADKIGKKPLIFAVNTANKFNIKNQKQLDSVIERTLGSIKKSDRTKLKAIGKNALLYYFSENPELSSKILEYFELTEKSVKNNFEQSIKEKGINESQVLDIFREMVNVEEFTIDNIFHFYFNENTRIAFELVLKEILAVYDTNLIELSHKLRSYELQGNVNHIMDYGCYIRPLSFRTQKLLFLHKHQITDKREINHPSEILKEEDLITFRIIGINQHHHRLNISWLDSFKPLKNNTIVED